MKLARVVACAAALAALTVVGCKSAEPLDGAASADLTELPSSCVGKQGDQAVAVLAVSPGAPCIDLGVDTGARGTWKASPPFSDAPASLGACIYEWAQWSHWAPGFPRLSSLVSVASVASVPPVDALRAALPDDAVLTWSCDDRAEPAAVRSVPTPAIPVFAGSAGCDVCGVVKKIQGEAEAWVVLPPDLVRAREFVVALYDGTRRAFAIDARPDARAVSVKLPPLRPAPGTATYVDGPVTVF